MANTLAEGLMGRLRRLFGSRGPCPGEDRELLQRFVENQDEAALTVLVERYAGLVWRTCRNVLYEPHDAEDAFQATFLVFVRKAASLDRPHLLAAWLHGVAYRIAVRARANAARRRQHEKEARTMSTPSSTPASDFGDLGPILAEEIERLPEKYRVPFVLCHLQGKTNEQAAQALGCPKGTILSRLARGRERLRRRLTRRGITLSAALFASALASASASVRVPPELVGATIKAALLFGVSPSTAAVSTTAAALADEVTKAMFLAKVKTATLLLLTVIVLCGGGLLAHVALRPEPAPKGPARPGEPAPEAARDKAPQPQPDRLDRFGDPLPTAAVSRLGTLRFRHGHTVTLIAFFPNGKWMVYGCNDPQDSHLRVADVETGREVQTLQISSREVPVSVAVAPDGKTLAASIRNVDLPAPTKRGNVVLWDAEGRELRRLEIPEGEATDLAFHPDGNTLALIAATERTLQLWDCSTGKPLAHKVEPGGKVGALAFSPDGKLLVFSSVQDERKSLCFWETNPWREQRWVPLGSRQPVGFIDGLAFSPDSKQLATIDFDAGVRFVDPAAGKLGDVLDPRPAGTILSLGFSADGKILAVGAVHPTTALTLWDVATRERLHAVRAQGLETRSLAVAGSSQAQRSLVATGGIDATVRLWAPATGLQQNVVAAHSAAVHTVALLADDRAVTVSRDENVFRLWKASTGEGLSSGSLGEDRLANVLAAPGANLLAVSRIPTMAPRLPQKLPTSFEKEIHLIDFTGKEVRTLRSETTTLALAVTPDGRTLASTEGPKRIAIWDVPAGKVVRRIDLDQEVYGLFLPVPAALSPDGKWLGLRLATLSRAGFAADRSFSVWDVTTGKQRWRMNTNFESDALAFSPDGKLFAEAAQGVIQVFDNETGKLLRKFDCIASGGVWYAGQPERLAFSRDSKTLLAGGCGPQVFLWDVTTGEERRQYVGHRGPVFSVSVSPDGKRFATAGADTTGMVWEFPQR